MWEIGPEQPCEGGGTVWHLLRGIASIFFGIVPGMVGQEGKPDSANTRRRAGREAGVGVATGGERWVGWVGVGACQDGVEVEKIAASLHMQVCWQHWHPQTQSGRCDSPRASGHCPPPNPLLV